MKTLNATTKACTTARSSGNSKHPASAFGGFRISATGVNPYKKWTDADYAGMKVDIVLGNGRVYSTRVKSWDSVRYGVVKKFRSVPKRRKLQYAERAECGMKNGHYTVNPVWASVRFTLDGPASAGQLTLSKDVRMLRKMEEAHPLAERTANSTNAGIEHYYGVAGATSPVEALLAQHHPKKGRGGIAWHAAPGQESMPEGIMGHGRDSFRFSAFGSRRGLEGLCPAGHMVSGFEWPGHHGTFGSKFPGCFASEDGAHGTGHGEGHGHDISEVFFRMYLRIPGCDPYAVCVHSHHAEEHEYDDDEGHHHGFHLHVSGLEAHGWHGHHDGGTYGHGAHGGHLPHAAWHSQHVHGDGQHSGHHGTGHGTPGTHDGHQGHGARNTEHGTHGAGHGHRHSAHHGSSTGHGHHDDGHSEVFFRVFLRIPGLDPYAVHISNYKAAAIRLAGHADAHGIHHAGPGGHGHGYGPDFVVSSTRRKIIYPKITQGAAGIST